MIFLLMMLGVLEIFQLNKKVFYQKTKKEAQNIEMQNKKVQKEETQNTEVQNEDTQYMTEQEKEDYTQAALKQPSISPEEATDVSLLVEKSKHMLYVYNEGTKIASYKVGLSKNPIGKKTQVGDKKVPEGTYYICTRNDKSKFYLSLGLSYPNETDAKEGLDSNIITKQQYDSILAANEAKTRPDWYTNLGGEIMIHGGEKGSSKDWTTGCVAVDNSVMDILWKYCKLQTKVTIYP